MKRNILGDLATGTIVGALILGGLVIRPVDMIMSKIDDVIFDLRVNKFNKKKKA
jgi:hypothetical protein